MKEISKIFSKEELEYIRIKRPELVPMSVPSISEAELLTQPSLDQIIVEFLKQYEVNVEPRSVGKWNGWDTLSTLSLLSGIYSNANDTGNAISGGALNIAGGILFANRSNQINSAAQDWGTWKRWALDHKDFEQFKEQVIQSIEIHNEQVLGKFNQKIAIAKERNKRVKDALKESDAKEYIADLIRIKKEIEQKKNKKLAFAVLCVPFLITFFIVFVKLFSPPEPTEQQKKIEAISNVQKAKQILVDKGYMHTAKNLYLRAIRLDPNNESLNFDYVLTMVKHQYKIDDWGGTCFLSNWRRGGFIPKRGTRDEDYWYDLFEKACHMTWGKSRTNSFR